MIYVSLAILMSLMVLTICLLGYKNYILVNNKKVRRIKSHPVTKKEKKDHGKFKKELLKIAKKSCERCNASGKYFDNYDIVGVRHIGTHNHDFPTDYLQKIEDHKQRFIDNAFPDEKKQKEELAE